jgi:protein involved in polysaccharide export with SLBB domain
MREKMTRTIYAVLLTVFVGLLSFGSVPVFAQPALPGASPQSRIPGAGIAPPAGTMVVAPGAATFAGPADENYRLGTGDKMKITVYGEDDLSGEFLVDGSGQVQFPLIGQVSAAGLTIHEFVAGLTSQLGAKYLRDPRVSVQIENYRPFYIMGEVNKPGEYPFESGLNVLGAIAVAGGYTYRANDNDVYIRRVGATKEETFPATGATKVYPGDVVRVAERIF